MERRKEFGVFARHNGRKRYFIFQSTASGIGWLEKALKKLEVLERTKKK